MSQMFKYIIFVFLNEIMIYGDNNYCGPSFCNNSKEHVLCKFQAWSEELAISAQRWADQCVTHTVPDTKDICRDLENYSVEQNIATIYDDAPGLTPMMLVDLWYIELLNVKSSVIAKYQRSSVAGSDQYDYFTQLIWAESRYVGCGAVKFKELIQGVKGIRNRIVYRLVCNFAPSGNQIGKSVYSVGLPCSRCPDNTTCDSVYEALCAPGHESSPISSIPNIRPKYETVTESSDVNLTDRFQNFTEVLSWAERNLNYDENISFDFFTNFVELTTKSSRHYITNTTFCKEVLIVDELFDLLKKKLSDDQTLRELLLTSKSSQTKNTEDTFTDRSVADILSHIYTTKQSITTTKAPNEYLNSTLLVDLVEAVIFRNNDKVSTSDVTDSYTQLVTEVKPVKIRAELGEIKVNSDFTGHYFFPEDNNGETSSDNETDNYYDNTDELSTDVAFEIENLKRNKGTKDFLEEILDADFITETISETYMKKISCYSAKDCGNFGKSYTQQIIRRKRRNKNESLIANLKRVSQVRKKGMLLSNYVRYSDLLRQLAADLKWLKLGSRFHCSQNNSIQSALNIYFYILICFYINLI